MDASRSHSSSLPSGSPPAGWYAAELLAETGWVRALAQRLAAGTAQDPDDLVQDTWVAALERRPEGDRPLRPWLRRVVRNRLAFRRRSESRRQAREHAVAERDPAPAADDLLERAEVHGRVVTALTGMREPQRSVLLLRYFGELTPAEIAQRRGVPAATVRSQLSRGLAELRAELDRTYGGDERRSSRALALLAAPPSGQVTSHLSPSPEHPTVVQRIATMPPAIPLAAAAVTAIAVAGNFLSSRTPNAPDPAPSAGAVTRDVETYFVEPSTAGGAPSAAELTEPPTLGAEDEARVTGVVRATKSDEPLAFFTLELRHAANDPEAGEPELLCSDGEGHFESARSYPAGMVSLTMIDHPDLACYVRHGRQIAGWSRALTVSSEWNPDNASINLRARVGPSYLLDLAGADDLDPGSLVASLEPVESPPWGALGSSWILRAPVRVPDATHDSAWIRFPRMQVSVAPDRPALLRVESADGCSAGTATVAVQPDGGTGSATIALARAACLEVDIVVAAGVEGPSVTLEADPGGARWPMIPVSTNELDDGRVARGFARSGLEPGTYRVLASVTDLDELVDTVTLAPGETAQLSVDKSSAAAGTRLAGELTSDSGTFKEQMTLVVLGSEGNTLYMAPLGWIERDGRWVAPFAVDDLPASSCEVRIVALRSHRRWSPPAMHVVPPAGTLTFLCRDTEPVHEVWVRVFDAASGEPVQDGFGLLELADCPDAQTSIGVAGATIYQEVAMDALVEWYAAAEGYVPRWGGAEAFVNEGERMVAEVALERGWGARLRAVRAVPTGGEAGAQEPLEGVTVLLDGEPCGVTDADGRLVLVRDSAPERVDFSADGWSYASGDWTSESGKLSAYSAWCVLRFEPTE